MAKNTRKITSTRKKKGTAKPAAAQKEPTTTPTQKHDEGWGPVGAAAKKVAKGALKGAAKEVVKKK
jgi:hypothetical protein